ncbi:ABC transporter ATP-binding protein [Leptolyngbya iicbica]|uniref:ABC transporter ATP-binding protein n=2 Tax=Cyanophyceae TaxID=3028117 RepID=A0A4Q7EM35_9CYAN|nr:ABC transporter ATP-binding protein [Leptolyngbya sp. LK]RZM82869.1 ABC transporter ATP-binding protein [Leptolyngbya sp. LK]
MSSPTRAIVLENLSKAYKRYHHPTERLKELLLPGKAKAETFWALRDINLEINAGETVGIIGRNGSGKSTLLQIIAGTLQPSQGEVTVNGRISALLELGSGFNPEFTGKQNVFFNGRILGLSQEEITARFDDIAAFADIGDFIHQPVKTYSSGMYVRLAFAVAINADPDILIVDEALSVGDEAFQRKCFARIYDLQEKGATVLFVSHSAGSIVELCDRAALIDDGELLLQGAPKIVIANYQKFLFAPIEKRAELREMYKREGTSDDSALAEQFAAPKQLIESDRQDQTDPSRMLEVGYDPYLKPQHTIEYQSQGAKIKNPSVTTLAGRQANLLLSNEKYIYSYSVYFSQEAFQVRFGMMIKTITGFELGGAASHTHRNAIEYVSAGSLIYVSFEFFCALAPGAYFLNSGVLGRINGEEIYLDRAVDASMFKVQSDHNYKATGIVDFQVDPKVSITSSAL